VTSESYFMHVLLVEDHEDTRTVLTKLIAHWGNEVAAADSVRSALSFLANFRFDAVVSDIGLPDGDGLQVVAAAKKRDAAMIAVALTAYGEPEDKKAGQRAGFDHYLTKPFDAYQLRSLLTQGAEVPPIYD
jgi:CheY-like chemotaxis protein